MSKLRIGVKPQSGSILEIKKELLFFDEIHYFPGDLILALSQLLIPENTKDTDYVKTINYALEQTKELSKTGKCSDPLVNSFFKDYSILHEQGVLISLDENIVIDSVASYKGLFEKRLETDNIFLNDFNNSHYLIKLINENTDFFKKEKKQEKNLLKEKILTQEAYNALKKESIIETEFVLRELSSEIVARLYSMTLNYNSDDNYIPILEKISGFKSKNKPETRESNKLLIFHTALNSISLPNINTPIQEILDFRNDDEARGHLLALNNWMIDLSKGHLSAIEISQKLDYLLHEYEKFIKIQKLKFAHSKLEYAITSMAEITENLIRLKFSDVSKKIFNLFKSDFTLMESEMKAPGREVAYISKIKNRFS